MNHGPVDPWQDMTAVQQQLLYAVVGVCDWGLDTRRETQRRYIIHTLTPKLPSPTNTDGNTSVFSILCSLRSRPWKCMFATLVKARSVRFSNSGCGYRRYNAYLTPPFLGSIKPARFLVHSSPRTSEKAAALQLTIRQPWTPSLGGLPIAVEPGGEDGI